MHGIFELKNKCKIILRKTGLLTIVCTFYRPHWWIRHLKCCVMARKRANGYMDERYSTIREYANRYKNERCFIICTGPSLTLEDVESLRGEYTFSMNSITKIFPQTTWRPNFYLIQDEAGYLKLEKDLLTYDFEIRFTSDMLVDQLKINDDYIIYPFDMLNHTPNGIHMSPRFFFSDNAYAIIYDGFSVTFSAMQLAVYMGFKEIYLVGCDCNYSGEKKHFINYDTARTFVPIDIDQKMIEAYREAKKYADGHGIKIYNATRGGQLEVFERVNLDEIIRKKVDGGR